MTGERIGGTTGEVVKVDVDVPSGPMQAQTGMHEIAMQESLLAVQIVPVELSNTRPIWAARNPQRPM